MLTEITLLSSRDARQWSATRLCPRRGSPGPRRRGRTRTRRRASGVLPDGRRIAAISSISGTHLISSNGKGADMSQTKIIGIALLVPGLGLGFWGYKESAGFGSQVSRAVTGSDTNKVMTLYIGGAVSLVVGLYLSMKKN